MVYPCLRSRLFTGKGAVFLEVIQVKSAYLSRICRDYPNIFQSSHREEPMYWIGILRKNILAPLFVFSLLIWLGFAHADEAKLIFHQAEQLMTHKYSFGEKQRLANTAQILGDHYRHYGRFKKAIELYSIAQSLGNRSKNVKICLNLCTELFRQKMDFKIWLESERTPQGTSIIVPVSNYAITMKKCNGEYHISLPLIFRYKGPAEKKQITLNRLKEIIPMVEAFYGGNGIQLHINYKIAEQTQLPSKRKNEINIWYEYALSVLGKGKVPAMDVRNWSIFKLNRKKLSKNATAYGISHEIGHLLGFDHPSMYLGPFHPAVIEFGNRFTSYSLMSYNSINSCQEFPDSFYIESQNKKRLLRPLLHPHSSDWAAAKLAKAYYYKDYSLLKEAILDLKKALPCAPDKKSVSELLYRFNDISLMNFTQMIEANPNNFYLRLERSRVLMEKGKWSTAMNGLNRIVSAYQSVGGRTETIHSLRLWPELITEALYLRGVCLAKLGKQDKAGDDFNAFVRVLTAGTDLKHTAKIQF